MKTRLFALALLLFTSLPLHADHFDVIVRALESKRGLRRVSIPFLGIARFFVRVSSPEGVHDFQLATFEGNGDLDPKDFDAAMHKLHRIGYKPLVRARSKNGEWSYIYARVKGERIELYVLAHDRSDTTLVRVEIDADTIDKYVSDPREATRLAGR